jgi:hypothetical protein
MKQFPKSEVGFVKHPSASGEKCSQCVHFQVLHKHGCERVAGLILPENYCERFFERKSKLAEAIKQ